jgi:signal peptidase I
MESAPSGLAAFVESVARAPHSTVMWVMLIATIVRVGALFLSARAPDTAGFKAGRFVADLADAIIYAGILVFLVIRPYLMQTFWIPSESMEKTLMKNDYLIVNKGIYRIRDPRVGEIVVFRAPGEALNVGQVEGQTDFIKRCIGVPGMKIETRLDPATGTYYLYRNDQKVEEKYLGSDIQREFKIIHLTPGLLSEDEQMIIHELGRADTPYYIQLQKDPHEGVSINGRSIHDVISGLEDKLWSQPAAALPLGHFLMMGDNRSFSSDGRYWGLTQRWRVIGRAEFIFLPFTRIGMAR